MRSAELPKVEPESELELEPEPEPEKAPEICWTSCACAPSLVQAKSGGPGEAGQAVDEAARRRGCSDCAGSSL